MINTEREKALWITEQKAENPTKPSQGKVSLRDRGTGSVPALSRRNGQLDVSPKPGMKEAPPKGIISLRDRRLNLVPSIGSETLDDESPQTITSVLDVASMFDMSRTMKSMFAGAHLIELMRESVTKNQKIAQESDIPGEWGIATAIGFAGHRLFAGRLDEKPDRTKELVRQLSQWGPKVPKLIAGLNSSIDEVFADPHFQSSDPNLKMFRYAEVNIVPGNPSREGFRRAMNLIEQTKTPLHRRIMDAITEGTPIELGDLLENPGSYRVGSSFADLRAALELAQTQKDKSRQDVLQMALAFRSAQRLKAISSGDKDPWNGKERVLFGLYSGRLDGLGLLVPTNDKVLTAAAEDFKRIKANYLMDVQKPEDIQTVRTLIKGIYDKQIRARFWELKIHSSVEEPHNGSESHVNESIADTLSSTLAMVGLAWTLFDRHTFPLDDFISQIEPITVQLMHRASDTQNNVIAQVPMKEQREHTIYNLHGQIDLPKIADRTARKHFKQHGLI